MPMLTRATQFLQRFRRDEEASATVEFVMLVPLVMWIVFSVIESGWLSTQQAMLNRGMNLAIRDLRLGRRTNPTADDIKQDICNYAGILRNCMANITLELVEVSNPIGGLTAVCVDRVTAIEPVVTFNPGSHLDQDIMVARACYVVDPLIPGAGFGAALPKDPSGGFHMVAFAAFVNEPGT
ncbi:MAG TPA: pilus assembly protein [Rhodobacteraceae bacterium]|nr:pilus assembly protein [Paracoccaceae bacterium]